MSDSFESRMSAMRARLLNLSRTVEQQEQEKLMQRRASGHRYAVEETTGSAALAPAAAELVSSIATPPCPTPVSRSIPSEYPLPRANGISERDANQRLDVPKKSSLLAHRTSSILAPTAPITRARGEEPAPKVHAMLQLARQHVTISTSEATMIADAAPLMGAACSQAPSTPAAVCPAAFTLSALPHRIDFSHVPRSRPGSAAGLPSYDFHERFPRPRRRTASLEASAQAPALRDQEGHTPYGRTHDESCITAAHAPSDDSTSSDEEVSFDAFRVVQERLRQKMKQLTTLSSLSMAPPSRRGAPAESAMCVEATEHDAGRSFRGNDASAEMRGFDDLSPSPRRPPGARAETATPTRSPDAHAAMLPDTAPPPPAPAYEPHGQGDASMEVEVLPRTGDTNTENSGRTCQNICASLDDVAEGGDEMAAMLSSVQGRVPAAAAGTTYVARDVFGDPAARPVRVSRMPSSDVRCEPIGGGQRGGSHEFQPPSAGSIAQNWHRGQGKSGRTATSTPRGVPSAARRSASVSAARSSATQERSRSTAGASRRSVQQTAARPKPISLNVEATILCAVTGAELFALLRMRGLIESEGNTEEYRLPPARCHRLYVTPEEHRQLKLLRQSLHALDAEEQSQDVPSYQRVTISARSRNAEFVPPPPVSRYMTV
ncbi:hypothetical protein LSCM1_01806 [Leishmania martiniquensis]|uniref:Uncharacterized protein n=1 Tax=Leishmania martiniquensis TaxID=1580590 RepID=A0A836FWE9_9TRYP|nr:hypothetical protein LSCM1_01806 [Leishmania martiniquensis]